MSCLKELANLVNIFQDKNLFEQDVAAASTALDRWGTISEEECAWYISVLIERAQSGEARVPQDDLQRAKREIQRFRNIRKKY